MENFIFCAVKISNFIFQFTKKAKWYFRYTGLSTIFFLKEISKIILNTQNLTECIFFFIKHAFHYALTLVRLGFLNVVFLEGVNLTTAPFIFQEELIQ